MKKQDKKQIKEELAYSVLSKEEQIAFLKDVLENMIVVLHPIELLTIESAFGSAGVNVKKDLNGLTDLALQNLYNDVDAKLKMHNVREFHFKVMSNLKNIKLSDLI